MQLTLDQVASNLAQHTVATKLHAEMQKYFHHEHKLKILSTHYSKCPFPVFLSLDYFVYDRKLDKHHNIYIYRNIYSIAVVLFTVSLPVHFRYVVFRPFVDEILIGRIKSCSKDGVHGELKS